MYDMLLAGLLFAFLWWFIRSPRREGVTALVFAMSYGCIRLLEDSLRIDKRFGPFTGLAVDRAHRRDRLRGVPDLSARSRSGPEPRRPAAENPFPRAHAGDRGHREHVTSAQPR